MHGAAQNLPAFADRDLAHHLKILATHCQALALHLQLQLFDAANPESPLLTGRAPVSADAKFQRIRNIYMYGRSWQLQVASTPEQRVQAAETYIRGYRRLLEPGEDNLGWFDAIPAPFVAQEALQVVNYDQLFGGEELSARSPVIQARMNEPELVLDNWRIRSTPLLTSMSQCTQPMSRDSQVTTSLS